VPVAQAGDTHHPSRRTLPATRTVEEIKEMGVVIIIIILRLTKRKQQEIGRRLGTNYRRKIDRWRTSQVLPKIQVI
jgi:hypothetical protein